MRNAVLIGCLLIVRFVSGQSMTFSPQNLVPNPSFEDTVACPTYISQLYNCLHWFNPTSGSPDYFNSCFDGVVNVSPDVPKNGWGFQYAHSGEAYVGIGGYYRNYDCREYLSAMLNDSLLPGHRYCFEFFVSSSDSVPVAINNLGIYLSPTNDTMYRDSFGQINCLRLPYSPRWQCDTIIHDSLNWVKLSGSFLATGGERFLIIGVFAPNSMMSLDTITGDGSNDLSYYFVDDVAIWDCDTLPVIYSTFTLYPNPSNGHFNITGNVPAKTQLSIYNMLGQKIGESIVLPEGNNILSINLELAQGAYYYEFRSPNELVAEGKFIIIE